MAVADDVGDTGDICHVTSDQELRTCKKKFSGFFFRNSQGSEIF